MSGIRLTVGCLACALLLAAGGCGKHETGSTGAGKVVAMVDGSAITQADVDRMAMKLLGPARAASMDATLRSKVIDGLVLSRVLSQAAEHELDAAGKKQIAAQVADFREQLLVKRYLKMHANPKPVTEDMVEDYYRKHPERFGGGERRHYQMLLVTQPLTVAQRNQVLDDFGRALRHSDWTRYVKQIRGDGLPIALRIGTDAGELPNEQIGQVLRTLKKGQTSDVVFAEGRPFLIRVTKVDKLQPRPLDEVRETIRRELFPVRVKEAIDGIKEQMEKKADIKIMGAAKS